MLGAVRGRILIVGVSAWLLGAGAATGGSLLAVSLIGQGMTGFTSQQMTGTAVNRVVGADTDEPSAGPTASRPSASQSPARPPVATATATASPSPAQAVASPSVTPGAAAASPSTPTASDGTVLTSAGGNVVAACQSAGAYLISWSPQQGYAVGSVDRGPTATAQVTFQSAANSVTMAVTCPAGVPTATSSIHSGGGHTDE
jgi:hypothetical protein